MHQAICRPILASIVLCCTGWRLWSMHITILMCSSQRGLPQPPLPPPSFLLPRGDFCVHKTFWQDVTTTHEPLGPKGLTWSCLEASAARVAWLVNGIRATKTHK